MKAEVRNDLSAHKAPCALPPGEYSDWAGAFPSAADFEESKDYKHDGTPTLRLVTVEPESQGGNITFIISAQL